MLYNKQLNPPYVPQLSCDEDVSLFDEIFVKEPAYDTPCKTPLSEKHWDAFTGFTYTRRAAHSLLFEFKGDVNAA